MVDLDLTRGVDLSALAKPTLPPNTTRCEVDGGCGFLVQGDHAHASKDDCLKTTLPYVQMYMECEEAAIQIVERYKRLEQQAVGIQRQNISLLEANQRLLADVNQYAAELRALRKDNPEAQRAALLAAAGDLNKAVKGPQPPADMSPQEVAQAEALGREIVALPAEWTPEAQA